MTINIQLLDGYKILSDKYQYILAFEESKRITHISFHNELADCVQAFVDLKIKTFNATSVNLLIQYIKVLEARLNKVLQPLKLKVVVSNEEGK